MITRVTITGADNTTTIASLNDLSYKYPFVEWGILVSLKHYGDNRFPSKKWLDELMNMGSDQMNLSCHLCGQYVRDVLQGNDAPMHDLGRLWDGFNRVQLNTHGEPHDFIPEKMNDFLSFNKHMQFIFQYDNVNTKPLESAINAGANVATLFDLSHGAGVLPAEWPQALKNVKCGYAGGLSPYNLDSQIQLIEQTVGDTEIWIDMQTHVRSHNGQLFDLRKVEECLQIASKYVAAKL